MCHAERGMSSYIVVCRGPNCRERGGIPLRKRLAQLVQREPSTHLVGYACFGQCDYGPNVAFFPEGTWYGDLRDGDAAERVLCHAIGKARMERPPLQLPEAEQRE